MSNHKKNILVAPSIFASDLGNLAKEAKKIEASGADAIHFDIMDGHFVPNLSLGPLSLAAVNRETDIFLDVHIMVYNPFEYIERLVEYGADRITFHVEATEDVEEIINYIKRCGVLAGLAICPETSVELLYKYLKMIDLALIMTVHPGFSGQTFIADSLEKIESVRHVANTLNLPLHIEVDGGIDDTTAPLCIQAGADVLVAGSYFFRGEDYKKKVEILRGK